MQYKTNNLKQKKHEPPYHDFQSIIFLFDWSTSISATLWHNHNNLCNKGINLLHLRAAQGLSGQQIVFSGLCIFVAHQTLKRRKPAWSF